MKPPKEVGVSLNRRFLTVDVPIDDDDLVESVFLGLASYVKKGFPIKVRQTYVTFSGTQEMMSRVMSTVQQVIEWRKEVKGLASALLRRH